MLVLHRYIYPCNMRVFWKKNTYKQLNNKALSVEPALFQRQTYLVYIRVRGELSTSHANVNVTQVYIPV